MKTLRKLKMNATILAVAGMAVSVSVCPCQQDPPVGSQASETNAVPHSDTHILGIIPNFRTAPTPDTYAPISPGEKFRIAGLDSFDRGTFLLAAAFAGEGQLNNDNRAFGQGVEGHAQYLGAAYADFVIGNYMTEAIFPTMLHQDPRYFRRGKEAACRGLATRWAKSFGRIRTRAEPISIFRKYLVNQPR